MCADCRPLPPLFALLSRGKLTFFGALRCAQSDHFPGCQNLKLTPLVEGAPNFRQVRHRGHLRSTAVLSACRRLLQPLLPQPPAAAATCVLTALRGSQGSFSCKTLPLLLPLHAQVAGLPVFGVAIPTVSGLRLVLERLGAAHGRRKVLWHNQREEPVM